jgi:hypothetical protein
MDLRYICTSGIGTTDHFFNFDLVSRGIYTGKHTFVRHITNYFVIHFMLSVKPKTYRGLEVRTSVVHSTVRREVNPEPLKVVDKPRRRRQGCSGIVFKFQPKVTMKCCVRKKCMSHFTSDKHPSVIAARKCLFDTSLTPPQKKKAVRRAWKTELKVVVEGVHTTCCLMAACEVFACSKAFMYTADKRKRHINRAAANSARGKKGARVSAWFFELKKTLDVMPDQGWFQLQKPLKNMVFEDYMKDVDAFPTCYPKVCQDYFLKVWSKNFPDVRIRKHCRFSKCGFCIKFRELSDSQQVSATIKLEARERLALHVNWAHIRERGLYHSKRNIAIQKPDQYLSVALDGTAQMINGFPHFWEITKKDAQGKRHALHTGIAIVHGTKPMVFLGYEDIAGNPNWIIEQLYRVLRREELARPSGLPSVLYLQVDNCFRENKNTYVMNYCCWLIERGVVKSIFVSFLPPGHTHFDPDQFASRISLGLKFHDVKTIEGYIKSIERCYEPNPDVVVVEDVMDVKDLFNPGSKEAFPVGTSRCHRTRGIGTKSVQPGRDWYMSETSPLHWRMRKDINGIVFIQSKFTTDDTVWSVQEYPWTKAERPEGRGFSDQTSGLVPEDVKMAPNNPLSEARTKELKEALKGTKHRLTEDQWDEAQELLERITTPRTTERPTNHGVFHVDTLDSDDDVKEDDNSDHLLFRPTTIFHSQSHQQRARESRKAQGHASNPIVVGKFVAYVTNYLPDVLPEGRQDFWVGKVTKIDTNDSTVHIQCWHTNVTDGVKNDRAQYRVWIGPVKTEWINLSCVLETFDLTPRGHLIDARTRRSIGKALVLHATLSSATGPVHVGVGHDILENPGERCDDADDDDDDDG